MDQNGLQPRDLIPFIGSRNRVYEVFNRRRPLTLQMVWRLHSADLAASWARGALSAKNGLTATDAKLVEDAFEQRLSELSGSKGSEESSGHGPVAGPHVAKSEQDRSTIASADDSKRIDKSALSVGAPRRYRNSLRHYASLLDLRTHALGCTSPSVHATACSWPKGE